MLTESEQLSAEYNEHIEEDERDFFDDVDDAWEQERENILNPEQ